MCSAPAEVGSKVRDVVLVERRQAPRDSVADVLPRKGNSLVDGGERLEEVKDGGENPPSSLVLTPAASAQNCGVLSRNISRYNGNKAFSSRLRSGSYSVP